MRISSFILCIQISCVATLFAGTLRAQTININISKAPVKEIFSLIEKQAGVSFAYNEAIIKDLPQISLKIEAPLKKVLQTLSGQLPLQFRQAGAIIGVARITKTTPPLSPSVSPSEQPTAPRIIKGKVVDKNNNPLPGVTVRIKQSNTATATNSDGFFSISIATPDAVLIFSYVGYSTQEVVITNTQEDLHIVLQENVSQLDQIQVVAYGTTTQRLTTGAIGKLSAKEIEEQPVTNPLATLEGRIPGVVVTQAAGLPGTGFNVQIRGQNSLANGSTPLYIVDGVPFNSASLDEVSLGYVSQQSPFSSLSPSDIDNIEVLKDAAATAIYGSRGANGVILITTKKGVAGKTKISVDINSGMGKVTRMMQYMNTQQYLQVREEAFKNDKRTITAAAAPDLLTWDTTRYINWPKLLVGGTAHQTNANVSVSGGNALTQFLIGSNYTNETTVFPGDLGDSRASVHMNLTHKSENNKFSIGISSSYSNDVNHLSPDLFSSINLPPDAPQPYDQNGNLNWSEKGAYYNNPLAYLQQKYTATTNNLISNTNISYKLFPALTLKVDAGYNYLHLDQVSIRPAAAQNPITNPTSASAFGNNGVNSWIIEPQISYFKTIGKGQLDVLLGASGQQQVISGYNINASGYSNDALLSSTSGATTLSSSSNYSEYRYQAVFGRVNYNWDGKYIVNLTGRRDGSSRFGPGKQYANFGAAGLAWIFSEETFIKNNVPLLSFGKLRGSYGITGNDQIGDYKYLDTWGTTFYPYQGTTGLQASSLFNPDYAWEINKKLELAIDLGLFHNRILFTADYFRNRSSNQLVNYTLPGQTGFSGILENLPALIQNAGWEFSLNTENIHSQKFKWSTAINLSDEHNKLLAFPGLATSGYANTYMIGQPVNVKLVYHYLGVDPATGIYQFNGTRNPADKTTAKDLNPSYFGGISNSFTYGRFQLDFLFQFVKQLGYNYYARGFAGRFPGTQNNQPVQILDRWQAPGDIRPIGIYTTATNSKQLAAVNTYFPQSDGAISDASFIRLRNIACSYNLPDPVLRQLKISQCSIYLRAENLLTITNYFGADPENQNNALPPLRYIIAGIRLTL